MIFFINVSFFRNSSNGSMELRSETQCSFLISLSLIEKSRYLAEAAYQLSYDVLSKLLPIFEHNLSVLNSVSSDNCEYDFFYMDFMFSLKVAKHSYEKLIGVVKASSDDKSLYENLCKVNSKGTLSRLCGVLDTIWNDYWKTFHVRNDKKALLSRLEEELVEICSNITIKGNEHFPESYRCLSCELNTGYIKTGRSDICDRSDEKTTSLNYCYHFIDINDKSKFVNINRAIFERRLNEIGVKQQ